MVNSLSVIKDSVTCYHLQPTRATQKSEAFAKFLIDLLAPHTKPEMNTHMSEWKINNVQHGALLYKCIINKSIVDNHHNTSHLEDWLEGLSEFMVACDSDLSKFHLAFNKMKGLLTGHGRGNLNFMKYLWHSYKICKDFEFSEYMKCKNQDYNENYLSSTLTIDEFIRSVPTYKNNHICGSKSPEELEIVALKAVVGQVKRNLQFAGKIMKKYGSTTSYGNTNVFNKNKRRSSKRIWILLPSRKIHQRIKNLMKECLVPRIIPSPKSPRCITGAHII